MKIAFSNEMGKIVSGNQAHECFLHGHIKNRQEFGCIDDNCNAKLTCANISKPFEGMKRGVYFKVFDILHSDECQEEKKILKKSNFGSHEGGEFEKLIDTGNYIFVPNRPNDYFEVKQYNKQEARREFFGRDNKFQERLYYTIAPFVGAYENFDLYEREKYELSIRGKFNISYDKFFNEIAKTPFQSSQDYPYVYMGPASFRTIKGGNIKIEFKERFIDQKKGTTLPSAFIGKEKLAKDETKVWKKRIEEVLDYNNIEPMVYIYGKYSISKGMFVNIFLKELDRLAIIK